MGDVNTSDRLKSVFKEGTIAFSHSMLKSILVARGVELSRAVYFSDQEIRREEGIVIYDDSFIVPVINHYYQRSWQSGLRNFFFKKYVHNFKILGIKTCMPGGKARGIYYEKNEETILRVGFNWLFEIEQDILTMLINRAIGSNKPGEYIKPLGCSLVADRRFYLFLFGTRIVERAAIIDAREVCIPLFNSTEDNNPDDKLSWVGKIDVPALNKVYEELTQKCG